MVKIIKFLIRAYQLTFSPDQGLIKISGGVCRFYPTCSEYFLQAVEKYGVLKGSLMGIKRIFRCHPWHQGGYDPLK